MNMIQITENYLRPTDIPIDYTNDNIPIGCPDACILHSSYRELRTCPEQLMTCVECWNLSAQEFMQQLNVRTEV